MTRTLVVGDVHGCIQELDDLLKAVEFRISDRLIFAGDLLDRGPDPVGVVRRARELRAESVLGNHEEKHLRYRKHRLRAASEPGYKNPMQPMRGTRLAEHEALSDEDWAYIEAMPLYLRIAPGWVVVHAGLRPGITVEKQDKNVLTRMRYLRLVDGKMLKLGDELATPETAAFWSTVWTGPESVIYGHHVQRTVGIDEPAPGVKCVGIDTGCAFGRSLTAAIFEDGVWCGTASVPARDMYCKRHEGEDE